MTVDHEAVGERAAAPGDEIEALRAELRRVERDYEARLRELANLREPPGPSAEASLGPYHLMLDLERARADLVARVTDLEEQRDRSEEHRHAVIAERDALLTERDAMTADRDDALAERDRLAARVAQLERELETITRSWSWRLGRRLVTLAKRLVPGR